VGGGAAAAAAGAARAARARRIAARAAAARPGAQQQMVTLLLVIAAAAADAAAVVAAIRGGGLNAEVAVDVQNVTHVLNPLFLGCHSDTGYAHQSRGLFSQLIMDGSFEAEQTSPPAAPKPCFPSRSNTPCVSDGIPWTHVVSSGAQATITTDAAHKMHGFKSMKISVQSGVAGVANLGNGGAGLFVEPDKSYDGYFFGMSTVATTVNACCLCFCVAFLQFAAIAVVHAMTLLVC
jgi:hypothetical protein